MKKIIFLITFFCTVKVQAATTDYLITNFASSLNVEETFYKLELTDEIKLKLKVASLYCAISIDNYYLLFYIDHKPDLINGRVYVRMEAGEKSTEMPLVRTKQAALNYEVISTGIELYISQDIQFFINLQNAQHTWLSKHLDQIPNFPIYDESSTVEEDDTSGNSEFGCSFLEPNKGE